MCIRDRSNAVKAYLPEVKFSFGANGFTAPIKQTPQMDAMGMGDMKNYLLNGSLQVNQLVYDGGAVCARKKVEMAQTNVDKNQLSVRLYDINSRVDELFFSILMIDEQLKQMKIMQSDLDLSPVSYTHLDVYKRQPLDMACAPRFSNISP